ncbi:acetyl esterase [Halobacillus alkaliphilus]|uniref:Acetyl esterase n=1 Tax=Halobacillus alkaliphilus TaxID=396056 RepID=A0A1I2PJT6_9BACI|nr:alpha/beta hydrolase [Halobacillus alkaliphilus]SFG15820.1 acetyl esterase [Halobacillus alkaliphilus]
MKETIAVDPQVTQLLKTIGGKMVELEHPPLDDLTPEQSREYYQVARGYFKELPVEGVTVEESYFQGRDGDDIPVRIYRPEGTGPFPVLVYFHGGGWVFGDLDSSGNVCRYLSRYAETIIVSVGYRLAPEHKYPAAFHDAIDAVRWTSCQLNKWKGDAERLAVGGESSGGNLAAAASIYFRDTEDLDISFQFLVTPVLDYYFDTLSYQANYRYNLTNEKMKWFFGHYLNEPAEGGEVYVSPLRMQNMEKLPQTLLVTAEYDPLREEGFSYAKRLEESGVPVDSLHYDDLVHSFINMIGVVDRAHEALEETTRKLKEILHN